MLPSDRAASSFRRSLAPAWAALVAVAAFAGPATARAQDAESGEPADRSEGHAVISAALGYGTTNEPNVMGLSGGLRIGYILPIPVYVGALGLLHAGTNDPGEEDVRHYMRMIGGELGYDIAPVAPMRVRASLRGGAADVVTPRDASDGFVSPWFGIGVTLYAVWGHVHAGVDGQWLQLTRAVNNGDNLFTLGGVALFANAGLFF